MIKSFSEITERVCSCERHTLAVASAHDEELLRSVADAVRISDIEPTLFGDEEKIKALMAECGITGNFKIVNVPDETEASRAAVRSVHDGESQVLMKGLVNTSDFIRAVLDKNSGLRSGNLLSHLAALEVPGMGRLLFVTDGGINIAPNLDEKKSILANALEALFSMGYTCPKVAVLTANEQVNPKAQATVDARDIVNAWKAGEFGRECTVEGPIALDVALSKEAAEHKGIESSIAGETDLILTSSIEVGNVLGKCMTHIGGAEMSGVVLGASAPIVLTSRTESAQSKLNSILLACCCKG